MSVGCFGCVSRSAFSGFDQVLACDEGNLPRSSQEYVDSVTYLPLKVDAGCFFREANKIVFKNGLIYILDFRNGKIPVFDMKGNPCFVIDRQGRGPGEYLEPQSFTVSQDNVFILDNQIGKVLSYDCRTGGYIRSFELPAESYDIEVLSDGGFVLAYSPGPWDAPRRKSVSYRILVTDPNFRVKESLLPFDSSSRDLLSFRRYLSASGDKIVLGIFHDSSLHSFDRQDGSVLESLSVRFRYGLPQNDRLTVESMQEEAYTYFVEGPLVCKDYVIAMARVGEMTETLLYDCRSGGMAAGPYPFSEKSFFNLVGSTEYAFVGLVDNCEMYHSLVEYGFTRADPASEAAILKGDPALVFYHMK